MKKIGNLVLCAAITLLPLYKGWAQPENWNTLSAIEKMAIIRQTRDLLLKSDDHEIKAQKLIGLASNYLLHESNDTIQNRMERLLIGITYFSEQYFYHTYEVEFQKLYILHEEAILNDPRVREKAAKIIFALSVRKLDMDRSYLQKAKKLNGSRHFTSVDCANLPTDVNSIFAKKSNANDFFYEMINSCHAKVEYLLKVRIGFLMD